METKQEPFSARESLQLIESMIQQTKGKVSQSSFYFLLWGWVIALCNFAMYYLLNFSGQPQYAPAVWMLCIPAWIATMIHGSRQERAAGVTTHLDRINKWLWICMAITITPVWIFGAKINWMITPLILMPVGAATFLSGIIIRFRPLLLGGIIFWVAAVGSYFVAMDEQYLVGGAAIILGYVLPGYLLKYQKEDHA
jgi:hypothetical protein